MADASTSLSTDILMRQFYFEQRSCRPRGTIDENGATGKIKVDSNATVRPKDMTLEEWSCIKMRLNEAAGIYATFTDEQWNTLQKIDKLYENIEALQFHPLRLLFIDMLDHMIDGRQQLKSQWKKTIYKGEEKPISPLEQLDLMIDLLVKSFSLFNKHFRSGNTSGFLESSKNGISLLKNQIELISILSESNSQETHQTPSWINALLDKTLYLLASLEDSKTLLPLLLRPLSSTRNLVIPSTDQLLFLKKTYKVILFSIDFWEERSEKLIDDGISYRKKQSIFLKAGFPHTELKELSNIIQNYYPLEAINRLLKPHQSYDIAYLKALKGWLTQVSSTQKEALKYFSDTVIPSIGKFKENLSEQKNPLAIKITEQFHLFNDSFNSFICDHFHYYQLTLYSLKPYCNRIQTYIDKYSSFHELIPAELRSAKSPFIRNLDLLIFNLNTNAVSLYLDQLDRDKIEELLFSIGSLYCLLKDIQNSGVKDLLELIAAILDEQMPALIKSSRGSQRSHFCEKIDHCLKMIKNTFPENSSIELTTNAFPPLYMFLAERTNPHHHLEKNDQQFDCFNRQHIASKTALINLDISQFEHLQQALNANGSRKAKTVAANYQHWLRSFLNCRDLIINMNTLTHENAFDFAIELMSYQKEATSIISDDIAMILESSGSTFSEELPDEEKSRRLTSVYDKSRKCFSTYIYSCNAPLMEWVKEEVLCGRQLQTAKATISQPITLLKGKKPLIEAEEAEDSLVAKPADFNRFHSIYLACCGHLPLIRKKHLKQGGYHLERLAQHYFPLIKEQMTSPIKDITPRLYSETLLLNAALSLEQALLIKISIDQPKQIGDFSNTHDLVKLATVAGLTLSEEDTALLEDAKHVSAITSRHLWNQQGEIASHLRNLPQDKEKIEAITNDLLTLTEGVLRMASGNTKIYNTPDPVETATELREHIEAFNCKSIEEILYLIELKLDRLRTIHIGSRDWAQIRNSPAFEKSDFYRKKQINQLIYDAPYYLNGLQETLPHLSGGLLLNSKTNFFFNKTTLLLEQSLLALIAYFDIPSEEDPDQHALLDRVGGANRPRYFDHDLLRSLKLLEKHLDKTFPQRDSVAKVRTFLSVDQRYLIADTSTEFGKILNEVRSLGVLSAAIHDGFLSKKQRDKLKRLFGENQKLWMRGIADKIDCIQQQTLAPLAIELLSLVSHLLDISLKEREQ